MTLLYGLVAFGQIQLRKIDGHRHVSELLTPAVATAAEHRAGDHDLRSELRCLCLRLRSIRGSPSPKVCEVGKGKGADAVAAAGEKPGLVVLGRY